MAEQQKAERGVPAWGWLLAYLGAVWLQLTASSLFPAQSPVPDVLLACSLVVGFLRGPSAGALGGTALGLTMDLIVGRLIGLSALTLGLAGAVAGLIGRRVFRENLLVLGAVALLLSTASTVGYALLAMVLGIRLDVPRVFVARGLPVGLYSSVLVPLGYTLGYRLRARQGEER